MYATAFATPQTLGFDLPQPIARWCKAWDTPIDKDIVSKAASVVGDLGLSKAISVSLAAGAPAPRGRQRARHRPQPRRATSSRSSAKSPSRS